MSTIVVPVYPSQLDVFKEKADLLANQIKKSLNIKVSKFNRYDYLAQALGYKGHDRLIENAKLIAQADKNELLFIFTKIDVCKQICKIYEETYGKPTSIEVAQILIGLGGNESIDSIPSTCLDDIKKMSQSDGEACLGNVNPNIKLCLDEFSSSLDQSESINKFVETNKKLEADSEPKRTNIDIMIDLADVPDAIMVLIRKHPKYIEFTNQVMSKNRLHNVQFDTLTTKAPSAKIDHWQIRAHFDSWCEVEPSSQLLQIWKSFKDWLMSFYVTGKIRVSERINSHRIITFDKQYAVSDPIASDRRHLKSSDDIFLFDALCDVPPYESFHKDPEWARNVEQGMLKLAKQTGRDSDLSLFNIVREKNPNEDVEWTCENSQCDNYEIPLDYPATVLYPSCSDCDEPLIKV